MTENLRCCEAGAAQPARGPFCSHCGAATGLAGVVLEPAEVPASPHPDHVWTARQERALRFVLRDIWDGHLGLWGETHGFGADRVVFGLAGVDWIGELLRRGWVERQAHDPRQLHLSEAGVQTLREYVTGDGAHHAWVSQMRQLP